MPEELQINQTIQGTEEAYMWDGDALIVLIPKTALRFLRLPVRQLLLLLMWVVMNK